MTLEELALELFRKTQAEAKLKRENITDEDGIQQIYDDVNAEIQATVTKLHNQVTQ